MAARWRKQPNDTGLARVCQGQRGFELREDGKRLMSVSHAPERYGHNGMWYWVGFGINTFGQTMFQNKEDAKIDADLYYKAHIKGMKKLE